MNPMTRCPRCGNYQTTQRVTALVASATWSGQVAGGIVGQGGGQTMVAGFSGVQSGATMLAQRLAPPTAPAPPSTWRLTWAFLSAAAGGGAYWIYRSPASNGETFPAFLLWVAVAFGALAVLLVALYLAQSSSARADYQRRQVEYQQAMAQWGNMWYCNRCDTVYDPVSGRVMTT